MEDPGTAASAQTFGALCHTPMQLPVLYVHHAKHPPAALHVGSAGSKSAHSVYMPARQPEMEGEHTLGRSRRSDRGSGGLLPTVRLQPHVVAVRMHPAVRTGDDQQNHTATAFPGTGTGRNPPGHPMRMSGCVGHLVRK